jgi:TolB-like protein
VLPFDNLSPDPDNAFFASGVHEDVLTFLSRVAELRVISRTSVQNYVGSDLSLPAIGRELGVSHVVEGSVRRAGDRVRVTVQLIDATTDEHVWAENYDRTLTDIFAIQTEIAQAIAGQLQAELSPAEVQALSELGTDNIDAYDLVIQGRELMNQTSVGFGASEYLEPVALFRRAVALDPDYRVAWLSLIEACGSVIWFGSAEESTDCRERIEADIDALQALAPDSADAAVAAGIYRYRVLRDNAGAVELLGPVVAERPNDLLALTYLALAGRRLDLWDTAADAMRRTIEIDPANRRWHRILLEVLGNAARYDEAIAAGEDTLLRFPDDPELLLQHAAFRLRHLGDVAHHRRVLSRLGSASLARILTYEHYDGVFPSPEAAMDWAERIVVDDGNPFDVWFSEQRVAQLAWAAGDRELPIDELEPLLPQLEQLMENLGATPQARSFLASYYAMIGRGEEALAMREEAMELIADSDDIVVVNSVRWQLARTLAFVGQPEAGWRELEPLIRQPNGPTEWDLVLDPFEQAAWQGVPAYDALVAETLARPRP